MGKWISRLALFLLALLPRLAGADGEPPMLLASADMARYLPSPDALIAKSIEDIRSNRLDDALREVNRVISLRPDFKLAS